MNKYLLVTENGELELELDNNSGITEALINELPLKGEGKNIGGEIFFNISTDIPFNGNEKEIFEVGDIVYWRSQKTVKFAIALFYGNTKFGDGNMPRAASPCTRFAKIKSNIELLKDFETGKIIKIIKK